jgi:hypothetical protein
MTPVFPAGRWIAVAWLAVWIPAYWVTWGWQNFLLLCDVSLLLTCIGVWRGSSLLISSQAVGGLLPNFFWALEFTVQLITRRPLFGGPEYMWMEQFPLWVRLLSLFHVALPFVHFALLRRAGYDPRGWKLQIVIAAAVLILCRVLAPEKNLNYIYADPVFGRGWGPAPVHLLAVLAGMTVVCFWPAHLLCRRLLPPIKH